MIIIAKMITIRKKEEEEEDLWVVQIEEEVEEE